MAIWPSILLAACIIMLASLSGKIFFIKHVAGWTKKNLSYLVSFSAGVFFIVAFHLAQETFELVSPVLALALLATGLLLSHLFSILFPEGHCHSEHMCEDEHNTALSNRILLADGLHNITDGLLLVPAFLVSPVLGITTAIGIFIHEVVQEISEYLVLRQAGLSTNKALLYNFLVSSTILIGVVLGLLITHSPFINAVLLGISSGVFFYTVIIDLVPRTMAHGHHQNTNSRPLAIALTLLGMLAIIGLNMASGDVHMHGGELHLDTHDHEEDIHEDEDDHDHEEEEDDHDHE